MKTLHLNLKRKWFDMILYGKKIEEYREIKPYWVSRFVDSMWTPDLRAYSFERRLKEGLYNIVNFSEFETITFSNGYSKDRDQFEIELRGIDVRAGKPEWGAEEGLKYFVLELGNIIKT